MICTRLTIRLFHDINAVLTSTHFAFHVKVEADGIAAVLLHALRFDDVVPFLGCFPTITTG